MIYFVGNRGNHNVFLLLLQITTQAVQVQFSLLNRNIETQDDLAGTYYFYRCSFFFFSPFIFFKDSEVVGLAAWNTASSPVRGQVAMDREDVEIAVRHIPGHHSYLEHLEFVRRHDRSIGLLDTPAKLVMNELFELLLGFLAVTQSLKRIVQVDESFGDRIGTLLAIGTMFRVGVDELGVVTNEVRRRTPFRDVFRNWAEEKEDGERLLELELLGTDANEPV